MESTCPTTSNSLIQAKCPLIKSEQSTLMIQCPFTFPSWLMPNGLTSGVHSDKICFRTISLAVWRLYTHHGYFDLPIIAYSCLQSLTPPSIYTLLRMCSCFIQISLSMNDFIIQDPSEQPVMLMNWLGNSLTSISARYLPKFMDILMAGMNGLSEYFFFSSSLILSAVIRSMHAFPMNLTSLLILSLFHCTAQISLSGMNFVSAFQCDFLSMFSDRNPLTHMLTTFLLGSFSGDRLMSLKSGSSSMLPSVMKVRLSLYTSNMTALALDNRALTSSNASISSLLFSSQRRHSMTLMKVGLLQYWNTFFNILLRYGSYWSAMHLQMVIMTIIQLWIWQQHFYYVPILDSLNSDNPKLSSALTFSCSQFLKFSFLLSLLVSTAYMSALYATWMKGCLLIMRQWLRVMVVDRWLSMWNSQNVRFLNESSLNVYEMRLPCGLIVGGAFGFTSAWMMLSRLFMRCDSLCRFADIIQVRAYIGFVFDYACRFYCLLGLFFAYLDCYKIFFSICAFLSTQTAFFTSCDSLKAKFQLFIKLGSLAPNFLLSYVSIVWLYASGTGDTEQCCVYFFSK